MKTNTLILLAVLGAVIYLVLKNRAPASDSPMINVSQTARTDFAGGGGGGGGGLGGLDVFGMMGL